MVACAFAYTPPIFEGRRNRMSKGLLGTCTSLPSLWIFVHVACLCGSAEPGAQPIRDDALCKRTTMAARHRARAFAFTRHQSRPSRPSPNRRLRWRSFTRRPSSRNCNAKGAAAKRSTNTPERSGGGKSIGVRAKQLDNLQTTGLLVQWSSRPGLRCGK